MSTTKVNGAVTLDEPLTETGRWQAESVRQQLIVGSLLTPEKKQNFATQDARMPNNFVMIQHIIHRGFCIHIYDTKITYGTIICVRILHIFC